MRIAIVVTLLVVGRVALAQEPEIPPGAVPVPPGPPLRAEAQAKLLAARTTGFTGGTFSLVTSFHFAHGHVAFHTESERIDKTLLVQVYPKSYRPTWRELMDVVARQTRSRWEYDPKSTCWVFGGKPHHPPFMTDLAPGWHRQDRGGYIFHRPDGLRVGLDIWFHGKYSSDAKSQTERSAELKKLTDDVALMVAQRVDKTAKLERMKEVTLKKCGLPVRYFECATPRPGNRWRQWVFMIPDVLDKTGQTQQAYAIVSNLPAAREADLLPDVEAMVNSFMPAFHSPGVSSIFDLVRYRPKKP